MEARLIQELPAPPYRYLTSEEAELLPLPLQLARLREINEELVRTHNHMVIQGARDDDASRALHETIATLKAELARVRNDRDELERLAYIGDHYFPENTYQFRLNEIVPKYRQLESELARERERHQETQKERNTLQDDLFEMCKLCHQYQNELWTNAKIAASPAPVATGEGLS